MSVAYIGPKSRTERPRKTKIDTEVGHVTRDSDTILEVKGQRSTSRGRGHSVAASRTACLMVFTGHLWALAKVVALLNVLPARFFGFVGLGATLWVPAEMHHLCRE